MDGQAVATAIATAVGNELEIRAYDYWTDNPIGPCACVFPANFQYSTFFNEGHDVTYVVRLFVPSANAQAGQQTLYGYVGVGAGTVHNAIETDNTLGGVVSSSDVQTMTNWGTTVSEDGTRYYSADITIEVLIDEP